MTPRQRRFVDEYLVDLNATQAAIRAGYAPDRAHVTGSQLVANSKVARAISVRQIAITRRIERSQDDVAMRLAGIAWTDMTDIAEWGDGRFVLRDSSELSEAARAAVKTLKVRRRREMVGSGRDAVPWEVESIEVQLDDRLRAAELFGRHIGMWPREAPQVNVDARSIVLPAGLDVEELRRLAAGVGDGDERADSRGYTN